MQALQNCNLIVTSQQNKFILKLNLVITAMFTAAHQQAIRANFIVTQKIVFYWNQQTELRWLSRMTKKKTQNKKTKKTHKKPKNPSTHTTLSLYYCILTATGYRCLIYQDFWHGKDRKYKDTGLILNLSFEISMISVNRYSQDFSALFLG